MTTIHFTLFDGDEEQEHDLPAIWCICSECEGEGKSSAYLGAFTGEEMRDDPDFFEDYRAGRYDRRCEACKGSGKSKRIDWSRVPKSLARKIRAQLREQAEDDAIARAERRMGA